MSANVRFSMAKININVKNQYQCQKSLSMSKININVKKSISIFKIEF